MNGKVTYRQQYTRCGKQRCRKCKEGAGHGPYWYAYWSENGRTISKYIGIHPPAEIEAENKQFLSVQEAENYKTGQRNVLFSSLRKFSSQQNTHETVAREGRKNLPSPEMTPAQPYLRVYLLGQFRVERKDGHEWQTVANRTWQRRRARALLGCLLSQTGRRMAREQVMEALWPDLDIETAANRLNGAVHELRQILEPGIARPASSKLLRLERDILILADISHIWVDAEAFETLLNRSNATKDPAQVEQLLEDAAALYEGDYLLEELYSEWAASRRESLRRGWMGLLLKLAELRAERGALTSAIEPLDRLLTADPTHETAIRRLMVLLTQLDRRGEAIRAYQRLAEILKRDYESEPLPETTELYQVLRQGQIQAPRPPSEFPHASSREQGRNERENASGSPPTLHKRETTSASPPATATSPSALQKLPRPALPLGRHNQSPLIGREHELETIRQILLAINSLAPHEASRGSKRTGTPEQRPHLAHFVMLMGETGIGKTRLAEELSQEAYALGWRVAWTRAYEQEGTIPYRPWTDILRTLLQDIPLDQLISMIEGRASDTAGALDPAATAQAKLTRLSSLLPELATPQAPQRPQTPAAPEQERFHLWEAMLSLLNAFSRSSPLLLVLDDLHWTDDSSLELLAYLARHQQNERIMLIGTCRDIELAPSASLRALLNDLRREQVLVTFPLQPLTQAQIGRLIAHLPHELVHSIQSQAGGNPLFAEELARFSEASASENGKGNGKSRYATRRNEQTGSRSGAGRPTSLPETVAAVLERRLNKLSAECQTLLSKAAVLGGTFEFSLLMRMMGETGTNEDVTLDLLEEALRSGLLAEEVSGTRIVYHFWHPLIVSHLYERLSAARRAQLHQRAAQALIELHTDNEAKGAAAIAYHLSKYGHEKPKLTYYAEIAGNQAIALSAYPEALHYYRLTLESLQALDAANSTEKQDPMHIANLLECMAECNAMQGNYPEARQQYAQALDLHKTHQKDASEFASPEEFLTWQQEEAQVQAMIWRAIGRSWKYTEYSQAHEYAERGKQVLRAAGITTGAAWACLQHLDGGIYWAEGNFTEARRYMEEALEIHQEVMRKIQANEGSRPLYRGDMPAPLMTHSRRALLGDPLELGRAHESLGVVAASMAQYTEALQHLHTALAIMEEHELIGVMSQVCSNIGAVYAMRAEYTIATTYLKRALELAERTGDIPSKTLVTGNLGDVAARNGDLQEAATWLTDSLSLAEQISDREHTSWALVALATVQQDLGDMRGALKSIRLALAAGRSMKSAPRSAFALVALADWRVACAIIRCNEADKTLEGRGDAQTENASSECQRLLRSARAAVERALSLADIDTETHCTALVILATIHYQLGELESAQELAITTLEECRQSEMTYLIGRAQRLLGEIQAASGLEQEANDSFEKALQISKQHGLRLDYARTLHRYGASLLQRSLHTKAGQRSRAPAGDTSYATGLAYLREARDIFDACKASIDLQWVECILADPTLLAVRS